MRKCEDDWINNLNALPLNKQINLHIMHSTLLLQHTSIHIWNSFKWLLIDKKCDHLEIDHLSYAFYRQFNHQSSAFLIHLCVPQIKSSLILFECWLNIFSLSSLSRIVISSVLHIMIDFAYTRNSLIRGVMWTPRWTQ